MTQLIDLESGKRLKDAADALLIEGRTREFDKAVELFSASRAQLCENL